MNFFQRRKILKKTNFLDLTPVRMHTHALSEEGLVILLVPKFKNPKVAKFMIPPRRSDHFKIKLDELGSATWLEIDGERKIGEIADILTLKFGDKIQPVNERLSKFCTSLYDNRYIHFKELLN
jgi:hypothetical protein